MSLAERSKFTMEDYLFFKEQRAIAEKLILTISGQEKLVETNKKCVKKSVLSVLFKGTYKVVW